MCVVKQMSEIRASEIYFNFFLNNQVHLWRRLSLFLWYVHFQFFALWNVTSKLLYYELHVILYRPQSANAKSGRTLIQQSDDFQTVNIHQTVFCLFW